MADGVLVDERADLWSAGVVLFECLAGSLPFGSGRSNQADLIAAILRDAPVDPRNVTDPGAVSDELAEVLLRAVAKDRGARFGSAMAMAHAIEAAQREGSDEAFDCFINYRVCSDGTLARALFQTISAKHQIGSGGRRPRVYLDKYRLADGQRFDQAFTNALAQSRVFVLLMSRQCLKTFADLRDDGVTYSIVDNDDFVLMEYIMALALHKQGIIKAILPVIVDEQEDGSHTAEFFQELRNGEVGGRALPRVAPVQSASKAAAFLRMVPPHLGGPVVLTEPGRTVAEIVACLALGAKVILTPPVYFIRVSLYKIYRGPQNDFNVHA